jgi:hypothetical protein
MGVRASWTLGIIHHNQSQDTLIWEIKTGRNLHGSHSNTL